MSRYIDADVLIDDLVRNRGFYPALVASAIKNTPTADVVEVVRCKDCKFCHKYFKDKYLCERGLPTSFEITDESFCSFGERSEE